MTNRQGRMRMTPMDVTYSQSSARNNDIPMMSQSNKINNSQKSRGEASSQSIFSQITKGIGKVGAYIGNILGGGSNERKQEEKQHKVYQQASRMNIDDEGYIDFGESDDGLEQLTQNLQRHGSQTFGNNSSFDGTPKKVNHYQQTHFLSNNDRIKINEENKRSSTYDSDTLKRERLIQDFKNQFNNSRAGIDFNNVYQHEKREKEQKLLQKQQSAQYQSLWSQYCSSSRSNSTQNRTNMSSYQQAFFPILKDKPNVLNVVRVIVDKTQKPVITSGNSLIIFTKTMDQNRFYKLKKPIAKKKQAPSIYSQRIVQKAKRESNINEKSQVNKPKKQMKLDDNDVAMYSQNTDSVIQKNNQKQLKQSILEVMTVEEVEALKQQTQQMIIQGASDKQIQDAMSKRLSKLQPRIQMNEQEKQNRLLARNKQNQGKTQGLDTRQQMELLSMLQKQNEEILQKQEEIQKEIARKLEQQFAPENLQKAVKELVQQFSTQQQMEQSQIALNSQQQILEQQQKLQQNQLINQEVFLKELVQKVTSCVAQEFRQLQSQESLNRQESMKSQVSLDLSHISDQQKEKPQQEQVQSKSKQENVQSLNKVENKQVSNATSNQQPTEEKQQIKNEITPQPNSSSEAEKKVEFIFPKKETEEQVIKQNQEIKIGVRLEQSANKSNIDKSPLSFGDKQSPINNESRQSSFVSEQLSTPSPKKQDQKQDAPQPIKFQFTPMSIGINEAKKDEQQNKPGINIQAVSNTNPLNTSVSSSNPFLKNATSSNPFVVKPSNESTTSNVPSTTNNFLTTNIAKNPFLTANNQTSTFNSAAANPFQMTTNINQQNNHGSSSSMEIEKPTNDFITPGGGIKFNVSTIGNQAPNLTGQVAATGFNNQFKSPFITNTTNTNTANPFQTQNSNKIPVTQGFQTNQFQTQNNFNQPGFTTTQTNGPQFNTSFNQNQPTTQFGTNPFSKPSTPFNNSTNLQPSTSFQQNTNQIGSGTTIPNFQQPQQQQFALNQPQQQQNSNMNQNPFFNQNQNKNPFLTGSSGSMNSSFGVNNNSMRQQSPPTGGDGGFSLGMAKKNNNNANAPASNSDDLFASSNRPMFKAKRNM